MNLIPWTWGLKFKSFTYFWLKKKKAVHDLDTILNDEFLFKQAAGSGHFHCWWDDIWGISLCCFTKCDQFWNSFCTWWLCGSQFQEVCTDWSLLHSTKLFLANLTCPLALSRWNSFCVLLFHRWLNIYVFLVCYCISMHTVTLVLGQNSKCQHLHPKRKTCTSCYDIFLSNRLVCINTHTHTHRVESL